MGFFSWLTSDTKRSIPNVHSSREPFTVYMLAPDGRIWKEEAYEGYGEFGGKDYYELLAELNGQEGRNAGIKLALGYPGIEKEKKIYLGQGFHFFHWNDDKLEDGKSANELLKEGWRHVRLTYERISFPYLLEEEPTEENWERLYERYSPPQDCPDQGYFY